LVYLGVTVVTFITEEVPVKLISVPTRVPAPVIAFVLLELTAFVPLTLMVVPAPTEIALAVPLVKIQNSTVVVPVPANVRAVVFWFCCRISTYLKTKLPVEDVVRGNGKSQNSIVTAAVDVELVVNEAPLLVNLQYSNNIVPLAVETNGVMPVVPISPLHLVAFIWDEPLDDVNVIPVLFVMFK
jgi:hypothetical protein